MTNEINNNEINNIEANEYHAAIVKRIDEVSSATNKQLVMKLATSLAMSKNTQFLRSLDVKAHEIVERKFCIYSLKQIDNIVSAITKQRERASFYDVSETVQACVRTAINFMNAKRTFTKRDLECCITNDHKIDEDKKALIYKKAQQHDAAYANRQSQIAMNVMRALKMLKQVNRYEFELVNNAATKAIVKLLK